MVISANICNLSTVTALPVLDPIMNQAMEEIIFYIFTFKWRAITTTCTYCFTLLHHLSNNQNKLVRTHASYDLYLVCTIRSFLSYCSTICTWYCALCIICNLIAFPFIIITCLW
eukprot:1082108_1